MAAVKATTSRSNQIRLGEVRHQLTGGRTFDCVAQHLVSVDAEGNPRYGRTVVQVTVQNDAGDMMVWDGA